MDLTVGSAVDYGWETFKKRPWFFVGATIMIFFAYLLVGIISGLIDSVAGGTSEDPTLVGGLVNFALSSVIGIGVINFFLAAHENPQAAQLSALWHPQFFWKFIGASILSGLVIGIGFVLLIVPGLIAAVFFMFSTIIVIDRGLGPIQAMKESMRIGAGYRWVLLGLIFIIGLIMLAGVIALFVGIFVAMPVAMLALVHAYRVLSARAGLEPMPLTPGSPLNNATAPLSNLVARVSAGLFRGNERLVLGLACLGDVARIAIDEFRGRLGSFRLG